MTVECANNYRPDRFPGSGTANYQTCGHLRERIGDRQVP